MHNTYETPQVEVIGFSLLQPLANDTDGIVDAAKPSGILP